MIRFLLALCVTSLITFGDVLRVMYTNGKYVYSGHEFTAVVKNGQHVVADLKWIKPKTSSPTTVYSYVLSDRLAWSEKIIQPDCKYIVVARSGNVVALRYKPIIFLFQRLVLFFFVFIMVVAIWFYFFKRSGDRQL